MRVLLVLALLGAPGLALAQEGTAPDWANKAGSVGVGANTTLGGSSGLHIRTFVTPLIGIELTFGFGMESLRVEPDEDGETSLSSIRFDIGLYGSYKLAYWQRGSLSTVLGFDVRTVSAKFESPLGDSDESTTDFLIGLGLQGEYFPTQYLSLFAQAGLEMWLPTDDRDLTVATADDTADYSGLHIGLGADLWGAAGFTVWFR